MRPYLIKKMPASSNFNQAIREAQTSSIVGPNVVQKALPYVGGGMVLTSLGVLAIKNKINSAIKANIERG